VQNNPIRYNDPTGHSLSESGTCPDGDCSYFDDWDNYSSYVSSEVGLCPDGDCSLLTDPASYNLTPEQKFIKMLRDPIHANDTSVYGGFGGCNTLTNYCSDGHHPGIDVGGERGDSIYAVANGIVVIKGDGQWGNFIVVKHFVDGEVFYSIYAHLDSFADGIGVGSYVYPSTIIGGMGNDGCQGCAVHLHFEVRTSEGITISPDGSTYSLHGAGYHADEPGDAWWPYRKQDLTTFWVDLGYLGLSYWVHYSYQYFDHNDELCPNKHGNPICWPYEE
jgi:murein DD-endopeptidase MepM/ murein hydrolase activator NlpD